MAYLLCRELRSKILLAPLRTGDEVRLPHGRSCCIAKTGKEGSRAKAERQSLDLDYKRAVVPGPEKLRAPQVTDTLVL